MKWPSGPLLAPERGRLVIAAPVPVLIPLELPRHRVDFDVCVAVVLWFTGLMKDVLYHASSRAIILLPEI